MKTNAYIFSQHEFPAAHRNPSFSYLHQVHAAYLSQGLRNSSLWSSLIKAYVCEGQAQDALLVYIQNYHKGIKSFAALPLLLKACATLSFILLGQILHGQSVKIGTATDVMVGTSILSMYSKCNVISDALRLFDEMPDRNVVTWNALIGGYSRIGEMSAALLLFRGMPACTAVTWAEMIAGFARRGDTVSARQLFDQAPLVMKNVVTWTVMVDGYARNGEMDAARKVFETMPKRNFYAWSSMVDGYCKIGDIQEARKVFDKIPVRNLVNWNALIAGYVQNGLWDDAIETFEEIRSQGFEPDEVTVVCALSACGEKCYLDAGKSIHRLISRNRIKVNQYVLNSLVDMYCKCGDLAPAWRVFDGMQHRSVVCWNAMISGLAIHGESKQALGLFHKLEESSERPNHVTYLAVLTACSHGGFVDEGLGLFAMMKVRHGLDARIEHYGCLVDLLGRAGRLSEARDLIIQMPMKPNNVIWDTLLGACSAHLNMNMAEKVMDVSDSLNCVAYSSDDAHYVLISNIYAASDKWEEAEKMRVMMRKHKMLKTPACSMALVEPGKELRCSGL